MSVTTTTSTVGTKQKIRAALIDLSGTIHIGDNAIPGAVSSCKKLMQHGVRIQFLTNTSKTSKVQLLRQLHAMGFDNMADTKIMTSIDATRSFLRDRQQLRPLCLVEGDVLKELGEDVSIPPPKTILDDYLGEDVSIKPRTKEISSLDAYNCVLVGLAPSELHYHRLNQAFRILMKTKNEQQQQSNESSPLIAIHCANYFRDVATIDNTNDSPSSSAALSLGPGPFIKALEEATNITAHVIGKPSSSFFHAALKELQKNSIHNDMDDSAAINVKNVVMIGDDIKQDIAGALKVDIGMTILVEKGMNRRCLATKICNKKSNQHLFASPLLRLLITLFYIIPLHEKTRCHGFLLACAMQRMAFWKSSFQDTCSKENLSLVRQND